MRKNFSEDQELIQKITDLRWLSYTELVQSLQHLK